MVTTSTEFKTAIQNGNPQYCLLDFSDLNTFFTNEDVSMDAGIQFDEAFNTDTDLTMGQCPASTLSFTLYNLSHYLDSFTFGKFTASLGVQIAKTAISETKNSVIWKEHSIIWNENVLYFDGEEITHPSAAILTVIIDGSTLYAYTESGLWGGTLSTSGSITTKTMPTLNTFMQHRLADWSGVGIWRNSRVIHVCRNGYEETIEFCPLGVFIADRPKVARKVTIAINAKDQMQNFDIDLPTITYPITVANLLKKICAAAGVTCATTSFINSDISLQKAPSDFTTATCRDVLGWIAEAACAYARFTRDGKLELAWFSDSGLTLNESNCSAYEEYWYKPKAIDKLVVRDSDKTADTIEGTGSNAYIIENNPLLG